MASLQQTVKMSHLAVKWNAEEGELGGSGNPEQGGQDQCTRVVRLGQGDVGYAGFLLEHAHWQS